MVTNDPKITELNRVLADGIRRCQKELSYTPSYFIRMLGERGPVETVRHLVGSATPSEGFSHLWQAGRLDLTAEYIALWPEFSCYFGDLERAATERLKAYGFDPAPRLAER